MTNYYRWLLLIPVLILILGTGILLSNEAIIKNMNQTEEKIAASVTAVNRNPLRHIPKRDTTFRGDIKSNRESAYPYFLLGTGLLVILLLLPKLTELSFSPTSGFTLKVLHEVKEAIEEVQATTQAVEVKAKQSFRASAPETLMATSQPDLKDEIKKLEENTIKLQTYSRILERILEKKGK